MIHSLILYIILFGTWIVLSGYFEPFFLISGAISAFIAVWFAWRMDVIEKKEFNRPLYLNWRAPLYFFWLTKEIYLSSINVAKIMWQVKPRISPTISPIRIRQRNDIGRALFANSITLTPGTIAIIVEKNQMLVHALERNGIRELKRGEMDKRVLAVTKDGRE